VTDTPEMQRARELLANPNARAVWCAALVNVGSGEADRGRFVARNHVLMFNDLEPYDFLGDDALTDAMWQVMREPAEADDPDAWVRTPERDVHALRMRVETAERERDEARALLSEFRDACIAQRDADSMEASDVATDKIDSAISRAQAMLSPAPREGGA